MNESAPSGRITVSVANGVASLEIDNPRQRNALTRAMCLELQDVLPRLEAAPDVTVITLRGAGTNFSAGAAINELPSVLLDQQADGTRLDHLSRADDAIASTTKPTVAVVDGACMGGGWQIASACDFILASERSVFAITPAKLGVIYPRAGIERLVRAVGEARAKYILFTGEAYSATRAHALGLVAEAVPDDAFEVRCATLVASLRDNSQFSVHSLKQLVNLTASDVPDIDQFWDDAWTDMSDGPDMGIGVAAFQNGERPRFTWTPRGLRAAKFESSDSREGERGSPDACTEEAG
ncbi:enoyl-CoA hydratase/isomerase family protein [Paenarthrobacter sp. PH39-S1]|uniref:enoyl-CoA hydratase/isomerase family protein n=1 Tax=Paenarthrobacter sp. PH39-S1 TaxID=3046204 RepID=UPI0024BB5DD6|nr:enoyl-CoA hydratase/isomerase family protein [Paenarthrobacter sp. PH39-S1]MDJ0358288.1 enoyl-CoA hydratase/isomerase family protein [Paenarthrobacter sp. PH39-S1]